MSHIFISYSRKSKDYDYAHKLRSDLVEHGFACWIDDKDIDYGSYWKLEIEEHIRKCSAFILVMSPNSRESKWVQKELALAWRLGKPIFPILLTGGEWRGMLFTKNIWQAVSELQRANLDNGKELGPRFFEHLRNAISQPVKPRPRYGGQIMPIGWIGIIMMVCLSTASIPITASALRAMETPTSTQAPTFTPTLTLTLPPTFTFTPTITGTFTITRTPTITQTPTLTFTPTVTDIPTFTSTPSLTRRPTKTATLACARPRRLKIGKQAQVDIPQINIKEAPGLGTNLVNRLKFGRRVDVIDGPVCVDDIWWWKVHYVGKEIPDFEGWAGEGDKTEYWLAPVP